MKLENDKDNRDPEISEGWALIMSLAEKYRDTNRIFRGETKPGRDLLPKIGRGTTRKDRVYNQRDEKMMLDRFKNQSIPYLSNSFSPRNELEWLAFAQHHGMATRLLDWTENVLVAAYFAVQEMGAKGPAIIYALNLPPFVEGELEVSVFTVPEGTPPVRYRPPHMSQRITVQKSVFSLHSNPKRVWPWREEDFEKFEISSTDCGIIKKSLDNVGINEASLFPGLDGLAGHLNWLYKWGR